MQVFAPVSLNSEVGRATGYRLDDRGVRVRVLVGAKFFSSPRRPDRFWGPSSLLSSRYWGLFTRGLKRPGIGADHLPPTSADVKNYEAMRPPLHNSSWRSAYLPFDFGMLFTLLRQFGHIILGRDSWAAEGLSRCNDAAYSPVTLWAPLVLARVREK
jgi:hypothetical protein